MSDQGVSRLASDFIASRVRDMAPSPTLAVSDKARALKAQGIDVVDLGGGDPDFITPEHIRKAAIDAMNAGETHYVASPGIPPLRKAIAEKLKTDNELEYDWNKEILVTPGGKASLFQAMLALVEPGVEILVLEPAWVSYGPMIEIAGGTPVSVTLDADGLCESARLVYLSVGDKPVEASQATAALTGQKLTAEAIAAAAEIAAGQDIDPPGDIHASVPYRRHLAKVLAKQVLATATARAK